MSIQEAAQQVLALAERAPAATVQQAIAEITAWNAEVQALFGDTSSALAIGATVEQAVKTGNELLQTIEIMKQAAIEAGRKHLEG